MTCSQRKRFGKLLWLAPLTAVVLVVMNLVVWIDRAGGEEASSKILDRYAALFAAGETATTKKAAKAKPAPDPRIERIAGRHLFAPAPPKKSFSAVLTGVLGETAYLDGGSAVMVGEKYKGAVVKALGPDWVELEVEGKTRKLWVFGPGGAPSGAAPSPGGPRRMGSGPVRMAGGPSPRPVMGPPGGFSPEMIAKMKKRFAELTPDQKAAAIKNMPPTLRAKLTE